ncbi:MAG: hypothetical protein LDL11_05470, partial [Desulfarculus sp.]|nr:hypothetical protein [Desulfarculus sp.]
ALIPFDADAERRQHLLTGDEPEYLLAAFNLAQGRGLTLEGRDQQRFMAPDRLDHIMEHGWHGGYAYFLTISPVLGKRFSNAEWGASPVLVHRPATSVLLAPAAWAGERQRWWSYAIMSLAAAGGLAWLLLLAVRAGAPPGPALGLGLAALLSPPALFYANQAFPELPCGMLLALSVALLFRPQPGSVLVAALCLAAAPWFSDRALPPTVLLGLAALITAPGRAKFLAAGVFFLDAAGLITYWLHHLGTLYPQNTHTALHASLSYIPLGFLQLFFSGTQGLLWFFPLAGLAPLAWWRWWRFGWRPGLCLLSALTWLALVAGISSWPDWTAGTCPRGRYAVMVQLLCLPALLAWARAGFSRRQAIALGLLAAWGLFYSVLVAREPGWWFAEFHPIFNLEVRSPLFAWLPDFIHPSPRTYALCAAWVLVWAALNWFLNRGPSSRPPVLN